MTLKRYTLPATLADLAEFVSRIDGMLGGIYLHGVTLSADEGSWHIRLTADESVHRTLGRLYGSTR